MSPAIPEAVQLIDAQILRYLALVEDLKSQRNALLPISQLPTEILGKIFHEVRGDHGHGPDEDGHFWRRDSFKEPCSKWIAVSHVSRHWRSVATNDASLWTNPPLKNPKLTMMMLDRSRTATIPAITLKIEELDKRVVATLTPHIPRVSSLVIPSMARETLKQVLTSLPSIAPQLRALSINSFAKITFGDYIWGRRSFQPEFSEAVVLPDDVLCHTPKLRRLQLNNIIIKSDSPLLSHLTTLSMSGIPEKCKPTPRQFWSMLASAPYLKILALTGVCPQQATMATVLMEHLEYLKVDETISRLIFFLENFSMTHHLKGLDIRVNYAEGSAEDLCLLFATLNQPYLYSVIGTSTDVRRLRVSKPEQAIIIQASKLSILDRNLEPCRRAAEWDDFYDSMYISIKTGIDEIEDSDDEDLMTEMTDMIISDLFDNFTWTGLSELELTYLDHASPHLLASTFGTIPQLRIIVANYNTAPWLIKALNHYSDVQSNSSGTLSLPFAGLRHIDMACTNLVQGESNFEALRKCVQQRHKCGTPIISLKFNHSRLEEEVVVLLKKYVEHIILTPAKSGHKAVDNYSPYSYDWYV